MNSSLVLQTGKSKISIIYYYHDIFKFIHNYDVMSIHAKTLTESQNYLKSYKKFADKNFGDLL